MTSPSDIAAEYAPRPSLSAEEREALILEHVPLLHHIVGRLAVELPARVDREDLLGYGMLGLIAAADAWDESRGNKFSTYAYSRIRGAVLDELRRADFLPRGRRESVREVDRVVSKLTQANGVAPTPEEIAAELGCEIEDVLEVFTAARSASAVSLDDGPSEELARMLADPRSEEPTGSAERKEAKQILSRAIAQLPDQERSVVTLYYGEDLLLREIGEILGVTESRVSQIHSAALYRLNRELDGSF